MELERKNELRVCDDGWGGRVGQLISLPELQHPDLRAPRGGAPSPPVLGKEH